MGSRETIESDSIYARIITRNGTSLKCCVENISFVIFVSVDNLNVNDFVCLRRKSIEHGVFSFKSIDVSDAVKVNKRYAIIIYSKNSIDEFKYLRILF